jgi:hypothetical protein
VTSYWLLPELPAGTPSVMHRTGDQHWHLFPAKRVVHPANREGRNPTHTFLLKDAGNAGCYIDRHV